MSYVINQVTVIGAGMMGAQIAALIASSGKNVNLLDVVPNGLTAEEQKKGLTESSSLFRNRLALNGLALIKEKKNRALIDPKSLERIKIGNLSDDLELISQADWIIEVVVEKLAIKKTLLRTIAEYRKEGSIVSTNTSGISVAKMVAEQSEEFKAHFLGTHFFNPPRYMKLVELVTTKETSAAVAEYLKTFLEKQLGKGVVSAKDTPNFTANRIGVYATLSGMKLMEKYQYNFRTVDLLTGPVIGRPRTGTFALADLVGLDIVANSAKNVTETTTDEKEKLAYTPPMDLNNLLTLGYLGNKTGSGFYKRDRQAKKTYSWHHASQTYIEELPEELPSLKKALTSQNKFAYMVYEADQKESKFVWEHLKDVLVYSANKVPEITEEFMEIDKAMKWGFNWELGPFEIWDKLDFRKTTSRMIEEKAILPQWLLERYEAGDTRLYPSETTSFSLRNLPLVAGNQGASLKDLGDDILLLEFHSKGNSLNSETFDMLDKAVAYLEPETKWQGLVISNEGRNFSAGADLAMIYRLTQEENWSEIAAYVRRLQKTNLRLKYASKPVVAAPFNMTLGGGAEVALHAHQILPHVELYMGLVEVGVGLVPGGGGCTQLLFRNMEKLKTKNMSYRLEILTAVWKTIATANVSGSAFEAQETGLLKDETQIIWQRADLIAKGKQEVIRMAEAGFNQLIPATILACGSEGKVHLIYQIEAMEKGGMISAHDSLIAKKLAHILAGGDLPSNTPITEEYICSLEQEAFVALCKEEKTQERIIQMLKTGKALRN